MRLDPLSTTLAALADPTRRAILGRLAHGRWEGRRTQGRRRGGRTGEWASVTELAEPFDMTLPAITKHLKVLENAGLIERGREAQWRPCRLRAEPLEEAADWLEQYRAHWEARLDRLAGYLDELQRKERKHGRKK